MPAIHAPFTASGPKKIGSRDSSGALSAFKRLNITQVLAAALVVYALSTFSRMSCHLGHTTSHSGAKNGASQDGSSNTKFYYALALARNGSSARIAAYVTSWARHSPTTRLVMFTEPALLEDPLIQDLYTEFKVESIAFIPPPFIDDPTDDEELVKVGRLGAKRLELFKDYVENNVKSMKGIALFAAADDAIIQADPWSHKAVKAAIKSSGVLVPTEGGPLLGNVTLEMDADHSRAIMDCFGRGTSNTLAPNTIANADVLFFSPNAAMYYLREMVDIITSRVRSKCLRNGRADIAAHNYVVYELNKDPRLLDFSVWLASFEESPVFCAAYGMPATVDGQGRLHRETDKSFNAVAPVIVQYASHPALLQHFKAIYRYRPLQLEFAQKGSYSGEKLVNVPASWMDAVRESSKSRKTDAIVEPQQQRGSSLKPGKQHAQHGGADQKHKAKQALSRRAVLL